KNVARSIYLVTVSDFGIPGGTRHAFRPRRESCRERFLFMSCFLHRLANKPAPRVERSMPSRPDQLPLRASAHFRKAPKEIEEKILLLILHFLSCERSDARAQRLSPTEPLAAGVAVPRQYAPPRAYFSARCAILVLYEDAVSDLAPRWHFPCRAPT